MRSLPQRRQLVRILAAGLGLWALLGAMRPDHGLAALDPCGEACPCDADEGPPGERESDADVDAAEAHGSEGGDDGCADGCADCSCRRSSSTTYPAHPVIDPRGPMDLHSAFLAPSVDAVPTGSTEGVFRPPRALLG